MFFGKKKICTAAMEVDVMSFRAEGLLAVGEQQSHSTRKRQTAMITDVQCYVEACLEH